MNQNRLGQVVGADRVGVKDAFHCPGVVVICDQLMCPGLSVRIVDDGKVEPCAVKDRHGVADPFWKGLIGSSTPFWMLIDPEFVTDLTHTFTIKGADQDTSSAPKKVVGTSDMPWEEQAERTMCDREGCS